MLPHTKADLFPVSGFAPKTLLYTLTSDPNPKTHVYGLVFKLRIDAIMEWLSINANSAASCYSTEQFCFQDELPFLVLLAGLISLIILPAHSFLTLSAVDVAYDVTTGGHIALVRLRLGDVYNAVEKICFSMLTAEVLRRIS